MTSHSPQDPSLVSGTLRSTLDQRGEHSDAELFAVLRRVHLLPIAGDDDGGDAAGRQPAHSGFRSLDSPIAQHGSCVASPPIMPSSARRT